MNGISKALCRLFTLLFFLVLIGFGVLSLVMEKPTVSETEKRELTAMPEFSIAALLSGEYISELEAHYTDTFPFREFFLDAKSALDNAKGIRMDGVRLVGAESLPNTEATSETDVPEDTGDKTPAPDTSAADSNRPTVPDPDVVILPENNVPDQPLPNQTQNPPADNTGSESTGAEVSDTNSKDTPDTDSGNTGSESSDAPANDTPPDADDTTDAGAEEETDPGFALERNGPVFIYGDIAFEIFGGTNEAGARYAQVISTYRDVLPETVNLYNIVVPPSVAFNLPKKYADLSNDPISNIQHIYDCIPDTVQTIDVASALQAHKKEYIFFGTDHHWTGLGAYYAYEAFAQAAGFEPLAYESYEKGTIENFVGSLYSATLDSKLKSNPDYVEYCKIPVETECFRYAKGETTPAKSTILAEFASGSNAYGVYLHGDYPRTDIHNLECDNGKSIIVIKESYGNAFAPYLIPHYEYVYVLDLRYSRDKVMNLVETLGVTDVLIINNAFAANTSAHVKKIAALLQ